VECNQFHWSKEIRLSEFQQRPSQSSESNCILRSTTQLNPNQNVSIEVMARIHPWLFGAHEILPHKWLSVNFHQINKMQTLLRSSIRYSSSSSSSLFYVAIYNLFDNYLPNAHFACGSCVCLPKNYCSDRWATDEGGKWEQSERFVWLFICYTHTGATIHTMKERTLCVQSSGESWEQRRYYGNHARWEKFCLHSSSPPPPLIVIVAAAASSGRMQTAYVFLALRLIR
jgi:hypothetical protein